MSAVPELAAAVSNAGALGMLTLTWSTPAGDVVRETAALIDRPFGGNLILASDQHPRLDEALEAGLRDGQPSAESTSWWRRAGRPGATYGVRSRRFPWCPPSWTRWHRCR
ncbi:MAG: nitronate monooxygenase [Acidimicrobiales bacterium]